MFNLWDYIEDDSNIALLLQAEANRNILKMFIPETKENLSKALEALP